MGLAGEPVANELGWAKHKMRYDEHNLLIEEAWFGPDDKPVMLKEGYALRKQHYNDVGQVIEEAYFGTGGEPVVSEDGYSRITKAYDALGRLVLRCNQMIQPILARPGSIGAVSSQGSESFV